MYIWYFFGKLGSFWLFSSTSVLAAPAWICHHCHWLYFCSFILSFRQCEMVYRVDDQRCSVICSFNFNAFYVNGHLKWQRKPSNVTRSFDPKLATSSQSFIGQRHLENPEGLRGQKGLEGPGMPWEGLIGREVMAGYLLGKVGAIGMVLNGIWSSRQKVTKSQEKVISAPRALLELKISYDTQKSSLTDLGYVIHATSIHSPFLHHMHGHIMSRRPQVTGEGLRHIGGVGEGHPAWFRGGCWSWW